MTLKEAVIASLQIPGYSEAAIDKALVDAGLTGSATYASGDSKSVDLVAIEVLQGMLSVSSVKEGGYSIGYSIEGIKARIDYLSTKNGLAVSSIPKIRSRNVW